MTQQNDLDKIFHDLESKCSSLKSAIALLRKCSPKDSKEMLSLMIKESQEITECLNKLTGIYK